MDRTYHPSILVARMQYLAKQVIIIMACFQVSPKSKNLRQRPPQPFPMPIDHRTESMPGIPAATITTPINITRVGDSVLVKGTAQNIGEEQYYLWLVLFDYNANRYYPQDGPVAVSSNGNGR